jgi:hypothetical protein
MPTLASAPSFVVGESGPLSSEYRGTSLIRNSAPLGPYRRRMPRVIGGSHTPAVYDTL